MLSGHACLLDATRHVLPHFLTTELDDSCAASPQPHFCDMGGIATDESSDASISDSDTELNDEVCVVVAMQARDK